MDGDQAAEATPLPQDIPTGIEKDLLDIGNAASWSASSYKAGHGIDALRNPDLTCYFESSAPQHEHVHSVTLNFPAQKTVSYVGVYLNHTEDDSYTPKELRLFVGSLSTALSEISSMILTRAHGWVLIPLAQSGAGSEPPGLAVHHLRLDIESCEQNGKDTRIRCMRVFGPLPAPITLLPDGFKGYLTPLAKASSILR